jgi:membrane associated rhomboid family serine protease
MAFFQDPNQRQPFLRAPAAVLILLAVLVAIYAIQAWSSTLTSNEIIDRFSFIPARYSSHFMKSHFAAPQSFTDQAIPFVSYIFLHGSWTHLLVNSVWLLAFGSIVARRFGALLFFLFFLLCGVAGAGAFLASNWGLAVPVVGASGAISGLMAAAFRLMHYPTPDEDARPIAPIFSRRILIWSVIWVIVNVVAGLTGLGAGPGPQSIAWQVHLGGYFAGLFLAGPFLHLRHRTATRESAEPAA